MKSSQEVSGSLPASGAAGKKPVPHDQLEISEQGRQLQAMLQRVNSLPDVRSELVNEIRQKLASGDYVMHSEKIAEGLIRAVVEDRLS